VRRLQRAGGTLKPEKVQEVYGYWLMELGKARSVNVADVSIDAAARAKVKTQVGDANFKAWERWERGIDEKAAAEGDKAAAPAYDPEGQLRARHAALWKATASMRAEMVQTEYLAQKINFGTGVKGTASRLTAGGYSAMYAVGGRTVSSVAEHAPMMVLTGVGTVVRIRARRAHAREAGSGGRPGGAARWATTSTRRSSSSAARCRPPTRPAAAPTRKYETAFHAFSEASNQFLKDQELSGVDGFTSRAKDIAAMDSAEKRCARRRGSTRSSAPSSASTRAPSGSTRSARTSSRAATSSWGPR
jgi:hypothetical protein